MVMCDEVDDVGVIDVYVDDNGGDVEDDAMMNMLMLLTIWMMLVMVMLMMPLTVMLMS